MNKIPTAEEFVLNEYGLTDINKVYADPAHIVFMMKEYAKLHVRAALQVATKEFERVQYDESDGDANQVSTSVILNAYPETNIK